MLALCTHSSGYTIDWMCKHRKSLQDEIECSCSESAHDSKLTRRFVTGLNWDLIEVWECLLCLGFREGWKGSAKPRIPPNIFEIKRENTALWPTLWGRFRFCYCEDGINKNGQKSYWVEKLASDRAILHNRQPLSHPPGPRPPSAVLRS